MKIKLPVLAASVVLLSTSFENNLYAAGSPPAPRNPIQLSSSSFNFGQDITGNPISKTVTSVRNTGAKVLNLRPGIIGDPSFTIVHGSNGLCGASLAPGASCDIAVQFRGGKAQKEAAVLYVGSDLLQDLQNLVWLQGESRVMQPGQVGSTANPQVAQYTLTLPYKGKWSVSFGPTTQYGRSTSTKSVQNAGDSTSMYVAGMLPNTTYHMQATVTLEDGLMVTDQDHTFTTGPLPANIPAALPVTLGTGTPQAGVELVDLLFGVPLSTAVVTDLQGRVIWSYSFPDQVNQTLLYPARLMPNGNFMVFVSPLSYPVGIPGINRMREIDLAGNIVHELSMDDLNAQLAQAGFSVTLANYSHDFIQLPNGHYLIIANTQKSFTDLPGYPGNTNVVGDVIVDLDENWKPVWLWNEFDHLDVNRHPLSFPDWTHSNSVEYSKDDGNFIVSMRHQNWIVKVDYQNGKGTGNILWRLGQGGDFTLKGAVDPTDWFYAQHDARIISEKSAGRFTLSIMDNGDDRMFPSGVTCDTATGPPCLYSSIQHMQLDEKAMTASFEFHDVLPPSLYSSFGGNAEVLDNGNIEFDLAGASQTIEITNEQNPQMVWSQISHNYRAYRIPSLYPGVQW